MILIINKQENYINYMLYIQEGSGKEAFHNNNLLYTCTPTIYVHVCKNIAYHFDQK